MGRTAREVSPGPSCRRRTNLAHFWVIRNSLLAFLTPSKCRSLRVEKDGAGAGAILLSLVIPYLYWLSLPSPRGQESRKMKNDSFSIAD